MEWVKIQDFFISKTLDNEGYRLVRWESPVYVKIGGKWETSDRIIAHHFDYKMQHCWSSKKQFSLFSVKDILMTRTRPMYLSHLAGTHQLNPFAEVKLVEGRLQKFMDDDTKEVLKEMLNDIPREQISTKTSKIIPKMFLDDPYWHSYIKSHVPIIRVLQIRRYPELFTCPKRRR